MTANDHQHGGNHYQKLKIQHWDYVEANGIPYLEACAIKYLTRWRDKGGLQDLHKAIHFIEKRIELEEKAKKPDQPLPRVSEYRQPFTNMQGEFTLDANEKGLGHWRCTSLDSNILWTRVDGWTINPFATEWAGPNGTWEEGLRMADKHQPLKGV